MRLVTVLVVSAALAGCEQQRSPMVASPTGDGKYWVLMAPLEYKQPKTKQRVVVPTGFVTDLASVPRLFWTAFPPCGKYTSAAVVHDYLYWNQSPDCDIDCADNILLVAMEESGVSLVTRTAIYKGVRLGGQSAWDSNAKAKAAGAIRLVPEAFLNFGPYDTWEQIERRVRNATTTPR
jgi:hypothetical protein